MSREYRFFSLFCVSVFFLLMQFVSIAEAGRSWVSNFDSAWDIQRVCQNGAEFIIVHTSSTTPDAVLDFPEIRFGLTAYHYTHEPPADLLDSDGNLLLGNLETDYYPVIGAPQSYYENVVSSSPIHVSTSGDPGRAKDYYLYISDSVRFYGDLAVGSWVLFDEYVLAQVEDCRIEGLTSVGESEIESIKSAHGHVSASLLVYQVESAASDGDLKLGSSILTDGSRFTAGQLDSAGLVFDGDGGEQSIKISAQSTFRVSVNESLGQLSGSSQEPSISADGTSVVFSTNGIISNTLDTNGMTDVAYHDLDNGGVILVSLNEAGTATANGSSSQPDVAQKGDRFVSHTNDVTFSSTASNLIQPTGSGPSGCVFGGDSNGVRDIFLWEKGLQTARRSVFKFSSADCGQTDQNSWSPSIAENKSVVFHTYSEIPISKAFDDNSSADVMGYRSSKSFLYSEIFVGDFPFTGNNGSFNPDISADGEHIVFESDASNLVANDTNGDTDIFVRHQDDPNGHAIARMTLNSAGAEANSFSISPAISRFGDHVTFASAASNLAPNTDAFLFQVYVRDRNIDGGSTYDEASDSCTVLVSKSSSGEVGNDNSTSSSISADGRFVAFVSRSDNLVAGDLPTGSGGYTDIFVHDRDADGDGSFYSSNPADDRCTPGPYRTIRVSVDSYGVPGDQNSFGKPDISGNGEFVAFASDATNLVPGDTNGVTDVFVHYLGFTADLDFSEPPVYRSYLPMINP